MKAPNGIWPWQWGREQHPPIGVQLEYGDELVDVEVVWAGWSEGNVQDFDIVPPEDYTERMPTGLRAAVWPSKTGLGFPALKPVSRAG